MKEPLKMRRFLVIRMSDNRGLTIDAYDIVHALNTVALDRHGVILAKNAEITFSGDLAWIKGDGFHYGAKEV